MDITGKVHCFFEQEEWRDIKGFEGLYMVSNLGRVKSLNRSARANTCGTRVVAERILNPSKSKSGYLLVVLCKNGMRFDRNIHRLVAESFINNNNKFTEINHKDENKLNNKVDNLEWCDRKYNANYGSGIQRCAMQKWKPVRMISLEDGRIITVFSSAKEAELRTGISRKTISSVCRCKTKTAGGYKWEFDKDGN